MNEPVPAVPAFTRFERLMLAVALRELGNRDQKQIRGLASHLEKLAAKLNIDSDLSRRADDWIASSRRVAN